MLRFKVCTCDVRTMMYVDFVASLLWADHKNSRYRGMQSFWTQQEQGRRRETSWRQEWQNRTVVRNVSRNPTVLARQVYDDLPPKISGIELIFKKSCESEGDEEVWSRVLVTDESRYYLSINVIVIVIVIYTINRSSTGLLSIRSPFWDMDNGNVHLK